MFVRGAVVSVQEAGRLVLHVENRRCLFVVTVLDEHRHVFLGFRTGERVVLDVGSHRMESVPGARDCMAFTYAPSMSVCRDAFHTVADLSMASYIDLYAVVTACRPLIETRGTDCLFTLTIADETGEIDLRAFVSGPRDLDRLAQPGAGDTPDYRDARHFERVFRPGDVLLIRNIKLGQGGRVALIHKSCHITKLLNAADAGSTPGPWILSFLASFYSEHCLCRPQAKTRKIAELVGNIRACVFGRVLHIAHGRMSSVCITDFTRNRLATAGTRDGLGPGMVLQIDVYGRHVEGLKDVVVGDVCLFENIKVRDIGEGLVSYMSESREGGISVVRDRRMIDEIGESERKHRAGCVPGGTVRFVPIRSIRGAGVHFIMCRIRSYVPRGDCLSITVEDCEDTLRVVARQRLTRSLVGTGLLHTGATLRCMILCLGLERKTNFMVSASLGDGAVDELVRYYRAGV